MVLKQGRGGGRVGIGNGCFCYVCVCVGGGGGTFMDGFVIKLSENFVGNFLESESRRPYC